MKASRKLETMFNKPYEKVILSSVKRQFLQACNAFVAPKNQQLSVLHIMFMDNVFRYISPTMSIRK